MSICHSTPNAPARRLTIRELTIRRLTTLSAGIAAVALVMGATAGPTHAEELIPRTDGDAEALIEERLAEDAGDLDRSTVPEGVSVEQAKSVVDRSDAVTTAEVEYAAAVQDLPASAVPEDFYESPQTLPERDGTVIKQSPAAFYLDPVKLIKHDAEATAFMYKTTDYRGTARAATATLLTPKGAAASAKDAVVIAPGTQGIADKCAPSRQMAMGTEYEGIGIASALSAKRPVVVVDYVGLGTEGPHRYLNRVEEGRSVLDAARAVQEVEGSSIGEATKLQLRGYSQGGQATAAALELAADWAPELNVTTASAGAVPADLNEAVAKLPSVYTAFVLYGAQAFAEQAGVDLADHLTEEGMARLEQASNQCTTEAVLANAFLDTSTLTKDGKDFRQLVEEEFTGVLEEQRIGKSSIPRVPVLVNHSRLDDVVPYSQGRTLASTWCRAGNRVTFEDGLAPTHVGGYFAALPRIEIFTNRTFAGQNGINSCWRL